MRLIFSIALYALFVIASEKKNASLINPYAVAALFSFGYFLISLVLFQYSNFKRKSGNRYAIEFVVILAAMHIYGSRMQVDSIGVVSLLLMTANILFSLLFIGKIADDCESVPNIRSFYIGAFGEYPVKTEKALDKVRPLLWFAALIPFASYFVHMLIGM